MLDADVDPFLNVPVSHALVDDDPDGGFGHVVDDTGFAVIDFMRHTEEHQKTKAWKAQTRRRTDPF